MLRNIKAASKVADTGEMVKGGGELVIDWNRKLHNVKFQSGND